MLALLVACAQHGTSAEGGADGASLALAQPLDETGNGLDRMALSQVTMAIADRRRSAGTRVEFCGQGLLRLVPRLIRCPAPGHPAAADDGSGCLESVLITRQGVHPGRGDEYVALGCDFDGWVGVGFDAAGWALLTDGLLRHGFGDATIRCVMGENFSRLLLRALH